MKDRISFVAVGQAGGNIGELLEEAGYAVLYINTSMEDLDTLKNAKYRYHIPGGEGCNKDRHKAKQLVIDDFDQIAAQIDAKIKTELIFVIFASGGGTGSGAGPMLMDLLSGEGKTTGAVTILPSGEESVKSHINAYECFTELTGIAETAACFILDNARGDRLEINQEFASLFTEFLDIPEKHSSVKGNIDRAEIMETLKAHGMSLVIRSSSGDTAQTIDCFNSNIYAPVEQDRVVKYITASLSGSVTMPELETAVGTPVDNFQTFNDKETICCLSGLTYPLTRLEQIYAKVEANRETIKKNLEATRDTSMKRGVNFLEDLQPSGKQETGKPQSKRNIMSKYL